MTTPYFIFPQKVLKREGAFNFFLRHWLMARKHTGLESNAGFEPKIIGLRMNDLCFDEDVNVYVAGLLISLFDPARGERESRYVRATELGVHELVGESEDRAFKFMAYRVNADHILTRMGLFDFLREDSYGIESEVLRGKRYYAFAAGYLSEIDRRRSALLDVMEKLSIRFEQYYEILSALTRNYLEFAQRIGADAEAAILRGIKKENKAAG